MLWRGGRRSDNVEDERGAGGGLGGGDLGGGGFGGGGIRIGGGLGLVAVIVIALLFGIDPSALLQDLGNGGDPTYQTAPDNAAQRNDQAQLDQGSTGNPPDEMKDFVSSVLASTEDNWTEIFQQIGRQYRDPKLVLFSNRVRSACGLAQSATGPFYCPADSKVYIDLAFYDELRQRFHAPGDFAQAYVIAHEIGHHVQHLLGLTDRADRLRSRMSETEGNALSVRIELQADCLAGIWANRANRTQHILEAGDIDEALMAASAIGDDRLQKQMQGYVVPDSFTHGTSAQRVHWFKAGFASGDLDACDTSGSLD
jgi:hypothetical protein